MSTFAMSDIHGHKKAFEAMLDEIGFSANDTLYVLGDIHDKGDESGEMLVWAIEEAPDNVRFLLGNHEDMAYSALHFHVTEQGVLTMARETAWERNEGWDTLRQISQALGTDMGSKDALLWVKEKMLPWIESLPLYEYVEVGGRPFMLVHGGFTPEQFDPPQESATLRCDFNPDYRARSETADVGHGFGRQYSQDMLWQREGWLTTGDAPIDTVFGHTYLSKKAVETLSRYGKVQGTGGDGKIAHLGNKHCIDCGCSKSAKASSDELEQGKYSLACLRLDDLEEFYVPLIGELAGRDEST